MPNQVAPSAITAQINKNLAAMRELYDDKTSDLTDASRAQLGTYLQKYLGQPTQPVTFNDAFPMTSSLMQNAEDVSQGKSMPWDPQHPFLSTMGKLQTASGVVAPALAPVTGALDLFGDAIKGIARPAYESATGQEPQLNFAEKAQQSMTSNRDIGDVALNQAVQDFPFRVQQLMKTGMPETQAVNQVRLEGLGKWMAGGTVENLMNVGAPEAVMHAPQIGGALADGISGLRATPPVPGVGVPDIIPTAPTAVPASQFGMPVPETSIMATEPAPAVTPQAAPEPAAQPVPSQPAPAPQQPVPSQPAPAPQQPSPAAVKAPVVQAAPMPSPAQIAPVKAPPIAVPTDLAPPVLKGPADFTPTGAPAPINFTKGPQIEMRLPESVAKPTTPEASAPAAPVAPPAQAALNPIEESAHPLNPNANADLHSAIWERLQGEDVPKVRAMLHELNQRMALAPDSGRLYQMSKEDINNLADEVANSFKKNNPKVTALNPIEESAIASPKMRLGPGKQMVLKDVLNPSTLSASPKAPLDVGEPLGPIRNPGQGEFDFTKGPLKPPELTLADLRAKLKDPNLSDAEFDAVKRQIADKLIPDKSAGILKEPEAPVKGPVKAPVEEAVEPPAPKAAKEPAAFAPLRKRKLELLNKADDLSPDEEAELAGINKKLVSKSPIEDLNTIINGANKRLGKKGAVGDLGEKAPLTPEEQAAIDRWKNEHAPAIVAGIKASGKSAIDHLSEQFPDLPPEHLKAMASAAESVMPKTLPKGEVPVETKDGRGQYKGKINVSKYTNPAVAGKIMDVIDKNPEIAKGVKVSDKQVQDMANQLHDGAETAKITKSIIENKAGTGQAELRAMNQQKVSAISAFLKSDLGKEASTLMDSFEKELAPQIKGSQKVLSEAGRTLREGGLPIEAKKSLAKEFDAAIERLKNDPTAQKKLLGLKGTVLGKEFNPSFADKAYYIWINGLVSGKHTYAMKTASDALNMLGRFPARVTESMWDSLISLKTGERTKSLADIPKMMKGLFSGPESMPSSLHPNVGHVLTDEDTFKNISPLQDDFSKKYIEPLMYGTKGLKHISQFFGQKMAQMEYEAIKDQKLDPVTLKNMIGDKALSGTLGDGGTKLIKALQYVKSTVPGARWFLPFQNTVGAILKQTINHTPYGLVDMGVAAKAGTLTQADAAERLTQLTHGTALMALAYGLWKQGALRGDISADPKVRSHQLNDQHTPENSLTINHSAIPLDSIAPYGSILSLAANMFDGFASGAKNTGSMLNATLGAILQGATSLAKRSSLAGVQNAIGVMTNPDTKGVKAFGQIASGFVPAAVKNVADVVDPTQRQANTIPEQFERRIPGASKGLQPVIDSFGHEVQKPVSKLTNAFNPFNIQDTTETPNEKTINNFTLNAPEKTVNGVHMSPQDAVQVEKWAGAYKSQFVSNLTNEMANMTHDEKQYILNKVAEYANTAAVDRLKMQQPAKYGRPSSPFSSRSR